MPVTVTSIDDLTTKLALTGVGWDKPRWDRFVNDLTPQEQALEAQMYADSAVGPTKSAWQEAMNILTVALAIAGAVSGISGAISAVQGVIKG
jgi:hypothetical protein